MIPYSPLFNMWIHNPLTSRAAFMIRQSLLVWLTTAFYPVVYGFADFEDNPLNGKHFRVVPFEFIGAVRVIRNASGYIENVTGPHVHLLEILSQKFNFTFSICQSNVRTFERTNNRNNRGALDYLFDGDGDMILGPILITSGRELLADFTFPIAQTNMGFLIPVPRNSLANTTAVLKPFQLPVWMLILTSILVVILTLKLIDYWHHRTEQGSSTAQSESRTNKCRYVVGMILAQGEPCLSRLPAVRLVAGVWCFATFALVNMYNSTLITYVIAPNNPPLVRSVQDVLDRQDTRILVEKAKGVDIAISAATERDGVLYKLRQKLDQYPESRCLNTADCVSRVKQGGSHIYAHSTSALKAEIVRDYRTTKDCTLQIADETFMNFFISLLTLPNNSPYTSTLSKGIVQLIDFGLIKHALEPELFCPCLAKELVINQHQAAQPLSFKNLTGAFVVLLIGLALTFLVFLVELVVHRLPKK